MTLYSKILGDVFSDYKGWVTRNPSEIRRWETGLYFIVEFLLGKFNKTRIQAEWLKSAFRLVSLFNRLIILHSPSNKPYNISERVNICVSVLEHCEIALEKSVDQRWGKEAKLNTIAYLQVIKFLARVTLVLHFKEKLIGHPCAELNIKEQHTNSQEGTDSLSESNKYVTLKSSGRIVRTIASAPSLSNRLWELPVMPISKDVTNVQLFGELLYVVKPIITLVLHRKYGNYSWKPWTCSLIMDLISIRLLTHMSRLIKSDLTPRERSIISERQLDMFYYIIRSPFFTSKIATPMYVLLYFIPLIGASLSNELRFYLSSYFFLWSR